MTLLNTTCEVSIKLYAVLAVDAERDGAVSTLSPPLSTATLDKSSLDTHNKIAGLCYLEGGAQGLEPARLYLVSLALDGVM